MTIPNQPDSPQSAAEAPQAESTGVLIVEDEALVAIDIKRMLTELGYHPVEYVLSAEEAIRTIPRLNPKLAVLDINLGVGGSGIDVANWIRREQPLPFVYLTANTDAETFELARTTEPLGFMQKPIGADQLRATIEVARDRYGSMEGNTRRIQKLEAAVSDLNRLLLSLKICADCGRVFDDDGVWKDFGGFLAAHLNFHPSHANCGDCAQDETKKSDDPIIPNHRFIPRALG